MQHNVIWPKALIKVDTGRSLTKVWMIAFSLLITSCVTPVDRYVTASGLPEVIIHAPTTKVKPRIIRGNNKEDGQHQGIVITRLNSSDHLDQHLDVRSDRP